MHLLIEAIRVDESKFESMDCLASQFGNDLICVELLDFQQSLECLFVIKFCSIQMLQNDLVGDILHYSLLMHVRFDVFDGLVLFVGVLYFPENVPFLLSIANFSPDFCLWNDNLHNFRRRPQMLKGIFL
jgi:hypothetical protein